MKKILITLISALYLVLFLTSNPLFAADSNDSDEIIRVGYIKNDALVISLENVGNEGYGYEILKKVEETSNFKFEFVEMKNDIFEALENKEVDIIGFYFHTPERAEKFLYLKTPLNIVQTSLMAPTTKNRIYDNPKLIDGKTVATYKGNIANKSLDNYLKKHNISVNYVVGNLQDYKKNKADYYLVYSSDIDAANFNNVMNFDIRYTYLLSRPEKKEMMDRLDKAVNELIKTEGEFFDKLRDKYMGKAYHSFHRSLTENELQILQKKTFKVAYHEIARPLTFTDEQGKADGALVDVMNRLAEVYNFKVEYYPYSNSSMLSVHENCDISLAAAGDAEYFTKNFTPSQSYMQLPIIAMVPREKIKGKMSFEEIEKSSPKIGALKYLYTDFDLYLSRAKDNSFIFAENFTQLLENYKKNVVDMIIMTQLSSTYTSSYLGEDTSFTFSADFDLDLHLSFANAIADEYVPIFNIMLDNISTREYEEILMQNQANYLHKPTFKELFLENIGNIIIFIFVLLSGILYLALLAQRKRRKELQKAYDSDRLTSLLTLRKLISETKEKISTAEDNTYELITFDIDMFKSINTHFGEEQGTQVLLNIARALEVAFKGTDALLSRKVDDQFVIVRRIAEGDTIEYICDKYIIPSIQKVVGGKYNLSLSFGIVTLAGSNGQPSMYLAQAENAHRHSKIEHKTTFVRFDDAMKKYYENKLNVTYRMKEALKNREFTLVYQPKIDFKTLEVGGAEALVRWFPKEGRTIFPDEFIPIFEQNGFILYLDLYVLEEVCKFIKENSQKMTIPRISVNLSAYSIVAEDLIAHIAELIDIYNINPKQIEFELTESAVERNPKIFLQVVQELKECGFSVSIDDFGAGVSSLNRISTIEAHVLKLDKAFFDLEGKEEKNKLVVSNVIRMAKDLNMMVVAEGVETKEQALWLREIKSDYAQGYYFAKPMPEKDFKELLISKQIFNLD